MTLISGREVLSPSPKGHFPSHPHHHHYSHEESSSDDEFLIANDLLDDPSEDSNNHSDSPHNSPDLLPFSLPQLGLNYLNNLNLLHSLPTPNLPNLGGIGLTFPNLRNSPLWRIYENSGFHQKRQGAGGQGQGSGWFLSSYLSGKEGGEVEDSEGVTGHQDLQDDIISSDSRYFTFTNFLRRHGFPFNEEDYYSEEAILERVRFKQQQKVKVQRSQGGHQRTKSQRSQVKKTEENEKKVIKEENLKILKIEREAEKELSERLNQLIKEEEDKEVEEPKAVPEVEVEPEVVEHVEKERVEVVESKEEMKRTPQSSPPSINPFYNRVELTFWNKVKIAFLTCTLFPIKVVMMAATLTLALLLVLIGMCGVTFEESQSRPFPKWRRIVRWIIANIVMRSFVFSSGFIWRIKETGKRAKPEQAPIFVVGPHSSYFDAFAVILLGAPSVVAKLSTKDIPVFGRLVTFTQAVYVSRESKGSRKQTMEVLKQRAQDVYHGNGMPQIFIFPEGTCANRSSLIKFKPGAFVPQVPVQPVLIRYPNQFDGCTWTFDGPPAARNIWYTFAQLFNRIEIEYLPVYVPNQEEKEDPALFAENVRKVMGEALGVPLSDYQFEDGTLLCNMREKKVVQKLRSIHRGKKALGLGGSRKEFECLQKMLEKSTRGQDPQMDFFQFQREFFHVESEDTVVPEVEAAFNSFKKERKDKKVESAGVGVDAGAEEFLNAEIDIRPYLIFTCILYGDCVEIREIPKILCQIYGEDESQQEMRRLLDNLFEIGECVGGCGDVAAEAEQRISRILDFAKLFADEVAERLPKNYPAREHRDKKLEEIPSKLKLE